jgi:putative RecB family exonuclease
MAFTAPPHLSPSSINSFLSCPLKFKFSKIDGMVEPPTEATLMGNFVHEILEELYAIPPDERTTDFAKTIARRLWDESYREKVNRHVHRSKHNELRWKSWFCVENLWGVENPQETELDGIEYELNGDLGGVRLKGFIDRYIINESDGRLVVGDYKTGKVPSPKWDDDKFFQLFIYAALLKELGVGEVSEVELIYLKAPKVLRRPVTDSDLQQVVETVVDVKNKIDQRCEEEYFETKKSPLCNWCHFKRICPEWT